MTRRAAYYGLAIVTLLNFVNYIDRYILASVLPRLKTDLVLTDLQLGLVANAFLVAYFLTSPLFGRLGDRGARTRLMAAGVGAWSAATAAAGLARSFGQIIVARAGVGIGEAAYATISPALLSDYFPSSERGRAFAVFYVAIPVGSAAGFLLGGLLERAFGWRAAFYAVGLPGVALALLALTVADPRTRGRFDDAIDRNASSFKSTVSALAKNVVYAGAVLGYAAYTFAVGGLAVWMPTYLERVRGVELAQADFIVGAITVVAGLGGTFIGGVAADRLALRVRGAHLWVSAASSIVAIVPTWLALTMPSRGGYLWSFFAAECLLFLSTSPINVVIVSVVPLEIRATAVALSIFTIHALGDAIAPPIIGFLADANGLERAVLIVPVAVAVSGVLWIWAARRVSS